MAYPTFASGDVLNASDMNAVGWWKITSQTIGSAVSSVPVTGVFSSSYSVYKVLVSGGASSANSGNNNFTVTLGATATGYYQSGFGQTYAGVNATANVSNGAGWLIGGQTTSALHADFTLFRPFESDETMMTFSYATAVTTGYGLSGSGYLNNTTSYTAFTITALGGTTLTGGTISVYGWKP